MPGNLVSVAPPLSAPPGSIPAHAIGSPGVKGLAAVFAALLAQHAVDLPLLKTGKPAEKDKPGGTDKKEKTTPDGIAVTMPLPPPEMTLIGQPGPNPLPNAGAKTGTRDATDTGLISPLPAAKKTTSELLSTTQRIKPQTALQSQILKTDTITRIQQAVSDALSPPVLPHPLASPMPEKDRTQMVRQVTEEIGTIRTQALPGGQGRMTLQLHPKDWGKLEVSVTLTPTQGADGTKASAVVAHIAAENPLVKAALDANPGELRRALREAGLALDKLTVSVQSFDKVTQSAPASGSHLSQDNGQGGFSQHNHTHASANAPTSDRGTGAGMQSFASFTGQSHGQRQGGGQPPASAAPPMPVQETLEPDIPASMTARAETGRLDLRV